ncbi:MAG TPA: acyl-CoA thioesterase [Treponema sp.]|nr:acyl-CoA thioesterase [Treponema sp.]
MKTVATLTVRSYELDAYNHVNNAIYLQYLEYGRMEFLKEINFDYIGLTKAGYALFITRVDIHYRKPAYLFDELSIEVEPTKLGNVSGIFSQRILNQHGEVCTEAEVTWCCTNADGKPTKIPQEFYVPGLKPDTLLLEGDTP